ncbi:uncharacterized protein ARMOST_17454 [Armillaria ostoyae]|uniref:Uncharacterized protein n=1 Tax=Armillaria ostoyae TaxID=47428 RepID=A0A284RZ07_ARMOS|nr:uncharacterized protein ARMOST_17454 [Armillaria ostoyae]
MGLVIRRNPAQGMWMSTVRPNSTSLGTSYLVVPDTDSSDLDESSSWKNKTDDGRPFKLCSPTGYACADTTGVLRNSPLTDFLCSCAPTGQISFDCVHVGKN